MIESIQSFFGSIPPWLYAVIAGVGVASWGRIQDLFSRLTTHLIDRVHVDADLSAELLAHLSTLGTVSQFGGRGFLVLNRYLRTERRQMWLLTRWLSKGNTMTFWVRFPGKRFKVPVWADRGKEGDQMTFRFIRGTFDIQGTCEMLVAKVNDRKVGRYRVIRCVGKGRGGEGENGNSRSPSEEGGFTRLPATAYFLGIKDEDMGSPTHQGSPKDLWWCPTTAQILSDAREWSNRRSWYHDRGIPWRRGYLLHGIPGSGKTSLARALAIDLDMPLYSMDLGSMDNQTLEEIWKQVRANNPCMVLIEDIDSVYMGRKANNPNQQLGTPPSFDALLNSLDGADPNDGVITIITTNKVEAVDAALSGLCSPDGVVLTEARTRPGRIDRVVRLPDVITEEGRLFLATRTLKDFPDLVGNLVKEGNTDTPAQFVERIIRAAQERT